MDAKANVERLKEKECLCPDSLKSCPQENVQETFGLKDCEHPTGVYGREGNGKRACLCPITPIPCRENGDPIFETSSPLTLESPKSSTMEDFNSTGNDGDVANGPSLDDRPRTPEDGIFDPFAPGPDEMLLAPISKKLVKESLRIVARRLNFDDVDDFPVVVDDDKDSESLSEKMLLDEVYETLLEAIVSKQMEDSLAENLPMQMDGLCTPDSPPRLTGIAETCPWAPRKAKAAKSRIIDVGLCRKLEF